MKGNDLVLQTPTTFVLSVAGHEFLKENIPEYMHESILMYLEYGIEPGLFLKAVLTNNLIDAALSADNVNVNILNRYAAFLWRYVPSEAYGSIERMDNWIDSAVIRKIAEV